MRAAEEMQGVPAESGAAGNHAQDAHIALLCREHGVEERVTADADFHRFAGFKVTNPFR
jgi:predicted nucleic acid-binding protein